MVDFLKVCLRIVLTIGLQKTKLVQRQYNEKRRIIIRVHSRKCTLELQRNTKHNLKKKHKLLLLFLLTNTERTNSFFL